MPLKKRLVGPEESMLQKKANAQTPAATIYNYNDLLIVVKFSCR